MANNPRGYNALKDGGGLQLPFGGQTHSLARKPSQQELQAFISQQLRMLSQEIYCRAASRWIAADFEQVSVRAAHLDEQQAKYFRNLAEKCQVAAKAYLEAHGVQFEDDKPADLPEQTTNEA